MPHRSQSSSSPNGGPPAFVEEGGGRRFLREFTIDLRGRGTSLRIEATSDDMPDAEFCDDMLDAIEQLLAERRARKAARQHLTLVEP